MPRCYFFVDSDGTEGTSNILPYRDKRGFWNIDSKDHCIVELPKDTIKTLFNIELCFKDDPICVNDIA